MRNILIVTTSTLMSNYEIEKYYGYCEYVSICGYLVKMDRQGSFNCNYEKRISNLGIQSMKF